MIVGALSHRTSIREVAYLSNVQQKLLFKGFSTVLSAGKLCLIMQVVAISDYSLLGLNEDWYKTTEGWLSIKQILIWHPLKWSLTAHCIMWDMEGIFEHLLPSAVKQERMSQNLAKINDYSNSQLQQAMAEWEFDGNGTNTRTPHVWVQPFKFLGSVSLA